MIMTEENPETNQHQQGEPAQNQFDKPIEEEDEHLVRNDTVEVDVDQLETCANPTKGDNCHETEKHYIQTEEVTAGDIEHQLKLLRDLLKIERQHNAQRRRNTVSLQRYLQQLQSDFLRQQQELVQALEMGHKIKAQKESQLALVDQTLHEKDKLIEQLRDRLAMVDEARLRQEFQESLEQQDKLAKLEQDQLRRQIECVEQQLVHERVNHSELLQKFQVKLEEQMKSHERELMSAKSCLKATQDELEKILNEPHNLLIKSLREDKAKLECQLDELNLVLDESRNKHDNLKKRVENLTNEQAQAEQRSESDMQEMQAHLGEQRRLVSELKQELEDKQEVVQILQFNLQRSEKRVRNLLGAMKGKEETYREMVTQLELKHEQEMEKNTNGLRSLERRLIESENELDKKQNQLVRLQLEHENQLESIKTDRDERINRLTAEKSRSERELQGAELKLAKEIEQSSFKTKQVDYLQREVKQFKEECKRLSIELTKSEAKLYTKQQELNQIMQQNNLRCNEIDNNNDKIQQMSSELDQARYNSSRLQRNVDELRNENDKLGAKLKLAETNLSKLSTAINREHNKMMLEYEKKLEQIKLDQSVFDKNKLRYKRYGYKLKKYCEHLRRVHQHLCNPSVCGYILGPLRAPAATNFSPEYKPRKLSFDKKSMVESSDDDEEGMDNDANEYASDCDCYCDTDQKLQSYCEGRAITNGRRLNRENYCVIDCDIEYPSSKSKSPSVTTSSSARSTTTRSLSMRGSSNVVGARLASTRPTNSTPKQFSSARSIVGQQASQKSTSEKYAIKRTNLNSTIVSTARAPVNPSKQAPILRGIAQPTRQTLQNTTRSPLRPTNGINHLNYSSTPPLQNRKQHDTNLSHSEHKYYCINEDSFKQHDDSRATPMKDRSRHILI